MLEVLGDPGAGSQHAVAEGRAPWELGVGEGHGGIRAVEQDIERVVLDPFLVSELLSGLLESGILVDQQHPGEVVGVGNQSGDGLDLDLLRGFRWIVGEDGDVVVEPFDPFGVLLDRDQKLWPLPSKLRACVQCKPHESGVSPVEAGRQLLLPAFLLEPSVRQPARRTGGWCKLSASESSSLPGTA